ncbi:MAG: erythromycin esterase family protein [Ignavibacteria bacterium]|nr:erythromycin esterase family protein [Ignavibacteria bacterium]
MIRIVLNISFLVIIFGVIFFISGLSITDDYRIEWLKNNTVKFKSVNPDDEDFSDLQPLKKLIGDSVSVVMLGEQTHGDGTTFLAKTRLIKFLHQEMGFDILAFESNMYSLEKIKEHTGNKEDFKRNLKNSIFEIWAGSNEVQQLLCYLQESQLSSNPLKVTGFDNQFMGNNEVNQSELKKILEDFLNSLFENKVIEISETELRDFKKVFIGVNRNEFINRQKEFDKIAEIIMSQKINPIAEKLFPGKSSYYFQLFESYYIDKYIYYCRNGMTSQELDSTHALRDIQMGKNLLWLTENNPDKKFIVWAATSHISRNLSEVKLSGAHYGSHITMGDIVHNAIGNKSYTIGFTAYEGSYGNLYSARKDLIKPSAASIEFLFNEAGIENGFIDFRNSINPGNEWLKDKIISRPLGNTEMYANWTKVMDGIVYTQKMIPSTKRNYILD